MDKNQIILSSFTLEQLKVMLKECLQESKPENSNNLAQGNEFLTVKDAAEFLKVTVISIHNFKKNKGLNYYRIGRSIRFKKLDLIAFAERKTRKVD